MLAVDRVLYVVDRLGAVGRHDISDKPPRGLRRFAGGDDVRRRRGGVVFRAFAQVLSIDERIVQLAFAYSFDDVLQIRIDRAVREQAQIQLALDLLRERRPIAPDDFHADELHAVFSVKQSRISFARAARAVSRLGQKQLRIQLLELELELARDSPAPLDVRR